jgi:hypothetical protein
MLITFREGGAPNGRHLIADYDPQTGLWSSVRTLTDGGEGTGEYDDVSNQPSPTRNSYHNGFHVDPSGRLHTTWTYREGSFGANHDIHYAYSDDLGVTWFNNADQLTGVSDSSPITLNSPGIVIVELDRQQALINQQGQIVDNEGGVHVLAYHRRQEPGFEWQPGDGNFFRGDSAYHHYYRDPATGQWQIRRFPDGTPVGSRPRITVNRDGDLFGLYTQGDQLIIAGAERIPGGYSDWQILHREDRYRFEVTPLIDNQRLLDEDILSVYVQERSTNAQAFTPSSAPLRVLEFSTVPPPPEPPVAPSELAAGWDRFSNGGVIAPSQTDGNTSGTTSNSGFSLDTNLRGNTDGTWGNLATPPADSTSDASSDSIRLINGSEGYYDFTITDTGGSDRHLTVFHFDSATFRPNSSRDYTLSIFSGDLTLGTVASGVVPSVAGGQQDWSNFDIRLDSLADNTLDANGSVTFRLAFTGGRAGSGGHHQSVDNVAVSAAIASTFVLGDCNQDEVVNFLDIAPFIQLLQSGNFLDEADCNRDGIVNFLDITAFIDILTGS